MAIVPRETVGNVPGLYDYFNTGDYPTESQFHDLIESLVHKTEDPLSTGGWISYLLKDEDKVFGLDIAGQVLQGNMTIPVPIGLKKLNGFYLRAKVSPRQATTRVRVALQFLSDVESTVLTPVPDDNIGLFKHDIVGNLTTNPVNPFVDLPNTSDDMNQEFDVDVDLNFDRVRYLFLKIRIQKVTNPNADYKFGYGGFDFQY